MIPLWAPGVIKCKSRHDTVSMLANSIADVQHVTWAPPAAPAMSVISTCPSLYTILYSWIRSCACSERSVYTVTGFVCDAPT